MVEIEQKNCFSFTPSNALGATTQMFKKQNILLRYIIVVGFISLAFVVVKFSIWSFLGLFFFGLLFPQIMLKISQEVVSNQRKTLFEKLFKNLIFTHNRTYSKFTFLVYFWAQFMSRKLKILLTTKCLQKLNPQDYQATEIPNPRKITKVSSN